LFLGIGRHPAHPYESVYRTEDKIVMREPRNEVMKVYSEEGLQKIDDFKEPEDHVAIEFEFMAYLCTKMKEALENKDTGEWSRLLSVQSDFFTKHTKSWVPAFCDDAVNGSSKYDFYPIWGAITKRCIALEDEALNKLTEKS
jgi:TorA maturation chaperone TorD